MSATVASCSAEAENEAELACARQPTGRASARQTASSSIPVDAESTLVSPDSDRPQSQRLVDVRIVLGYMSIHLFRAQTTVSILAAPLAKRPLYIQRTTRVPERRSCAVD